jgi:hypothetical protein
MLKEPHLKLYKSLLNSNNNKAIYNDFLSVWELAFVVFNGLFFEFLTHQILSQFYSIFDDF